ncbi:serine dehydratase beta chain, partial [Streptomyces sp. NPDC056045]
MSVSVFDLFKIGIGPSSSHTVGPMRAALMFVHAIESDGRLEAVSRIRAELYGSLGATGKGHGTDKGVMLGLMGQAPDTIDADEIDSMLGEIYASGELRLAGVKRIPFSSKRDIVFYRQALPEHPNGMKLFAFDDDGAVVR